MSKAAALLALVAVLAAPAVGAAAGPAGGAPTTYAPSETVMGRTLTDWNVKWLRWEFSPSQGASPLFHPEGCKHLAVGKLWLLPGLAKTGVTISCRVPAGTSLYVPTAGYIGWPDKQTKVSQLKSSAHALIGQAKVLDATVDGHRINVRQWQNETGLFSLRAQPGSIFPKAGTWTAAAAAYNFILQPLAAGKHVIKTHIRLVTKGQPPFDIRTTFRIDVA